ncbi:MAG: ribonuclease III [Pseudomonadota bacterium]
MSERPKRTRQRAAVKAEKRRISYASIDAVEAAINYTFSDKALLVKALTHPSALTPDEIAKHSNQRLEFLGDRVLGLVIAERLFERRPGEREGALAPRLNRFVRKEACATAVRSLGLGIHIVMAPNEVERGGRERDSTLGDMCEALIAAIYLDGGLSDARKFIERAWAEQFKSAPKRAKDPKTRLQEYAQANTGSAPRYSVVRRKGPDHAPVFTVRAAIDGATAEAEASSKQDAERLAAQRILEQVDPE